MTQFFFRCILENLEAIFSWFLKLVAFVVLYLSPISSFVHIVLILLLIDNITGIWASLKAGDSFTARKLRATVTKFVLYSVAIITGYLLQSLLSEGTNIARIVAFMIGSVEAVSIYENIAKITGMNLFTAIADYIKNLKTKQDDNTRPTSGNDANSPMGVD